jgi:tetratricopeptide (TPR) repeat protein
MQKTLMKISKIRIYVFFLTPLLCFKGLHADNLQEGIRAYEAKQYTQAIERFSAAIDSDNETASARHNLALAYFQSGQPAEALWQLERAHRLEPSDKELIVKTQALKQVLGLFSANEEWFEIASKQLSYAQWIILCASLFWILVALHLFLRSKAYPLSAARILAWIMLVAAAPLTYLSFLDSKSGQIIRNQPVELRAAPASAAPATASRLPGSQGRILDAHENFYLIKTPEGPTGWISKDDFRPYYKNTL